MKDIRLRDAVDADLEVLFRHQNEPEANRMAVFMPRDRDAFMAHHAKILKDPSVVFKTILHEGRVAGSVASFVRGDMREVCYWIGREFWNKGLATRALSELLTLIQERPLYARVAKTNLPSIRVLEKCSFQVIGEDRYTDRNGEGVEEFLLKLEGR